MCVKGQNSYDTNTYLKHTLELDTTLVFDNKLSPFYSDSVCEIIHLDYWSNPIYSNFKYRGNYNDCEYLYRICFFKDKDDTHDDVFHIYFNEGIKSIQFYTQTLWQGRVGTFCDRKITYAKYNVLNGDLILNIKIEDNTDSHCDQRTYVNLLMKIKLKSECD